MTILEKLHELLANDDIARIEVQHFIGFLFPFFFFGKRGR